jgi:hypothetical protein
VTLRGDEVAARQARPGPGGGGDVGTLRPV